MSNQSKTEPKLIYDVPTMLPEISNIRGTETHLIFKFGYKQNNYDEESFVITSSIALTFEQAEQLANQISQILNGLKSPENKK